MRELYDDTYRIVDHNTPDPLSWIGYSPQEDPVLMSGAEKYMDEYLSADLNKTMGISFDTWMGYPYWKRKLVIKSALRHLRNASKTENTALTDAAKEMERLFTITKGKQP